jgi:hypothetical protein
MRLAAARECCIDDHLSRALTTPMFPIHMANPKANHAHG